MKAAELKQFLIDSNKAGYAGGEEKKWTKEIDGSTSIPFAKGPWSSHDNFFGGEPYGGRTVVFYEDKPFWIMVYYGFINKGQEVGPIYKILRESLKRMPSEFPYRGPKIYVDGDFTYSNSWKGSVEEFSGKEKILKKSKLVYQAKYMGGLVDQRGGV